MEQRDYVRRLLDAYRVLTPGTCGAVRRTDRVLAAQLHQRGVPLEAVENAFVLAAVRRLIRPAGAAPLGTIRSLAYFSPVIEEVLQLQVGQEYFQYLRHRTPTRHFGAIAPFNKISASHAARLSARMISPLPPGIKTTARLRRGR